ncbi:MAG: hypothetical protein BroJett041_23970 [Candidatus Jettenia caeni]|nr:MAG: hypothetical protein BroJett041_23970 [Candidatus Jettenia caeni]
MNRIFDLFKVLISLYVLIAVTGCTRPENKISKLSFQIPSSHSLNKISRKDTMSMSTSELAHVIINVTGDGLLNPLVFNWDINEPSPNCNGYICTIDVPQGYNRLIQVLAVTQSDAGDMDFFYGDSLKNLLTPDESVVVSVGLVSSGSAPEDIEIFGRYLTSATDGPTGQLKIEWNPGNGKPYMEIMSGEVFGGWFKAFALSNIKFRYAINGTVLFGGDVTGDEISNYAAQSQVTLQLPDRYESWGGDVPVYHFRPKQRRVFGFFGPGVTNQRVCYATGTGSFNYYYSDQGITKIQYNGDQADVTKGYVISTRSPGQNSCTGYTEFVDSMNMDFATKGVPHIRSPFGNESLLYSNGSLTWTILPGSTSSIKGMRLFGVSGDLRQYEIHGPSDGFDCNRLSLESQNGIVTNLGTVSNLSSGSFSVANLGSQKVIGCLIRPDGLFYRSGISYWGSSGSCTSCNGGTMYGRLNLAPAQSVANEGACAPVNVSLTNYSGTQITSATPLTVALSTSNGAAVYSDSNCGTLVSQSGIVLPANSSTATVYISRSTNGWGYLYANAAGYDSGQAQVAFTIYSTPTQMIMSMPTQMAINQCYPVLFEYHTAIGDLAIYNTANNLTPTVSGFSGSFYASTDSTCSGASISSINIPASSVGYQAYFKPTSTTVSSGSISLSGGMSTSMNNLAVGSSTIFAYQLMSYNMWNNEFSVNQCYEGFVSPVNNVGAQVSTSSQVSFSVTPGPGVHLYTQSNCSGTEVSSIANSIYTNMSQSSRFWFSIDSAAATQLTATVNSTNYPLNLTPQQPLMVLDGSLGYDIISWGDPLLQNFCYRSVIRFKNPQNQSVDMAYNGTLDILGDAIYTDPSCTTSPGSTIAVSNSSNIDIYYKPTASSFNLNIRNSVNHTIAINQTRSVNTYSSISWSAAAPTTSGSHTIDISVVPNVALPSIFAGMTLNVVTNTNWISGICSGACGSPQMSQNFNILSGMQTSLGTVGLNITTGTTGQYYTITVNNPVNSYGQWMINLPPLSHTQ